MNFYFLLEDEKSFLKILPMWLEYINFGCQRVADIQAIEKNNYILQSGQGVTQLVTKVLFDTIDTIKLNPGKIDKLVIVLDAEELETNKRRESVQEKIAEHYPNEKFDFDIHIFVCNRCFETWLLGCNNLYPIGEINPKSDFFPYYDYYDIQNRDPESMRKPNGCRETTAKYHFHYLHELLRYKKIRYSKSKPQNLGKKEFFDGIIERIETTDHLMTFGDFYDFLLEMKSTEK